MKLISQGHKLNEDFIPEVHLSVSFTLHELQDGKALGDEYYAKVGKEILELLEKGE